MTQKQITHIREEVWHNEVVNDVITLCGSQEGSISWDHAREGYDGDKSAVAGHLNSLELCGTCWDEFKLRYDPHHVEEHF